MWTVRVKDRGRDLVTHAVERAEEAQEMRRIYELLGYKPEKIQVEKLPDASEKAA